MYIDNEKFAETIAPFFVSEYEGTYSLCLEAGSYLTELFETRADEGFLGNGYDWESLAQVFLDEIYEEDADDFEFDSEAGMFCVYSDDEESLAKFALAFKNACEDAALISDLFTRAELQ